MPYQRPNVLPENVTFGEEDPNCPECASQKTDYLGSEGQYEGFECLDCGHTWDHVNPTHT